MDIRVAILQDFERGPGSPVKAGEIVIVGSHLAEQWVSEGKACYYSDYNPTNAKGKRRNAAHTGSNEGSRTEEELKAAEEKALAEQKAAEEAELKAAEEKAAAGNEASEAANDGKDKAK